MSQGGSNLKLGHSVAVRRAERETNKFINRSLSVGIALTDEQILAKSDPIGSNYAACFLPVHAPLVSICQSKRYLYHQFDSQSMGKILHSRSLPSSSALSVHDGSNSILPPGDVELNRANALLLDYIVVSSISRIIILMKSHESTIF